MSFMGAGVSLQLLVVALSRGLWPQISLKVKFQFFISSAKRPHNTPRNTMLLAFWGQLRQYPDFQTFFQFPTGLFSSLDVLINVTAQVRSDAVVCGVRVSELFLIVLCCSR